MARCHRENLCLCVVEKLDYCYRTKQQCCVGINYPGRASGFDVRGCRVLLIVDNPDLRDSLGKQLMTWGLLPHPCKTGEEAMVLLKEPSESFELLIVDSVLKGQSGEDLILEMEKIPREQRPKTILLTPLSDKATKSSLVGVSRVTKPVFTTSFQSR